MEPFRITIEHFDEKVIVQKNYSDVSFDDCMDMLKNMMSIIYSKEQWDEYFNEE